MIPISARSSVLVHDPAGFCILVDAHADDPISVALRTPPRWFKRWLPGGQRSCGSHLDLLRRLVRPGDRVLDLGAHIGTFTLAAATLGCEVVAVEAAPRNAELLRASVAINGFNRVRVVEAAISDTGGTVSFSPYGPFGHVCTRATNLPTIEVLAVRIDDLCADVGWDRVHLIKMDVEGSEITALNGMPALLTGPHPPMILYESNSHTLGFYGQTPDKLRRKLGDFGFQSYRQAGHDWIAVRPDEVQHEVVVDYLAVKEGVRSSVLRLRPDSVASPTQ
jgi:FkbM family methyltransferase